MESFTVSVDLGGGDDTIELFPPPVGEPPPDLPEPAYPSKWDLDFHGGSGDDVMTVQPCVVPGLDLTVVANLGDGDDALHAAFAGPAAPAGAILPRISLDVAVGEGNDAIQVAIGNPNELEPLRVAGVHGGVRGFGGDASGILDVQNVAVTGRFTQFFDLGDGDDCVATTLTNVTVDGLLKQSVNAGDGADEVGMIINGRFGAVAQKVHTGAGEDAVSLSWKGCEILGPAVTRMSLGEGDDEGTFFGDGSAHVAGSMAMTMNTGGGDDFASVLIQDSEDFEAFEGPVVLRLRLGDGDDLANVVVRDANDVAGPLTVGVTGGTGDDGIAADVDFTPRVRAGQLDPGNAPASVLVALHGGTGLDTIDARTEGEWAGTARFILRGGDGEDAVGWHWGVGQGSTGALAVDLDGGAGDDFVAAAEFVPTDQYVPVFMRLLGGAGGDVLSLSLLGGAETTPEPHLFVLDGGDGFDLARAPAGAIVRNCEGKA
jgi:hypothetical protein